MSDSSLIARYSEKAAEEAIAQLKEHGLAIAMATIGLEPDPHSRAKWRFNNNGNGPAAALIDFATKFFRDLKVENILLKLPEKDIEELRTTLQAYVKSQARDRMYSAVQPLVEAAIKAEVLDMLKSEAIKAQMREHIAHLLPKPAPVVLAVQEPVPEPEELDPF